MSATRRQILAGTGALGAGVGIAFTGALSDLFAGTATAQSVGHTGYGPLVPDPRDDVRGDGTLARLTGTAEQHGRYG